MVGRWQFIWKWSLFRGHADFRWFSRVDILYWIPNRLLYVGVFDHLTMKDLCLWPRYVKIFPFGLNSTWPALVKFMTTYIGKTAFDNSSNWRIGWFLLLANEYKNRTTKKGGFHPASCWIPKGFLNEQDECQSSKINMVFCRWRVFFCT